MADKTRRIRESLAQQIDKKNQDIQTAESEGRGNDSEVRAWKFQSEQWQKVLDTSTKQDDN